MSANPHNYSAVHRAAERERQSEFDDFWRGANAAWAHLMQDAHQRLQRSTTRLQSALRRHQRVARPCR
jgi:hypothetical protein